MTETLSRPKLLAWRNAIFVIFALSGLSIASWVARLPAVRDQLGVDVSQVGLIIFGLSAGAVLGLVAAPLVLTRIGGRSGMLAALCVLALGTATVGVGTLAGSVAVVVIGLFVLGFANGALDVMMNVEGAAAERAIGKTLLPLMHAFFSFGTVAGAGLGALASALSISVAVHLAAIAVIVVASAFTAIRFVPRGAELSVEEEAAAAALPRRPLRVRLTESLQVWKDVRLLMIGIIILGMAFAEGSANDWLAIAVVDGFDESNTLGAVVFGVFTVSMTVGRIAGGPLIDRFGRVPVLRVSALAGFVGLAAFIFAPNLGIGVVGVVLWALGCSLGFPVGMSAAADIDDPRESAARVSAVAIIGYVAFLVGPPVLGFLGHEIGILHALLLVLVLVALAGIASPAARERSALAARAAARAATRAATRAAAPSPDPTRTP